MKSLLILVLLFPLGLMAQEPTGETTLHADSKPFVEKRRVLEPVHFFLNGVPVPIFSGGMGGAIEYVAIPQLSFWFGFEREQNAPFISFGNENGVRYDNRFLGTRYYYRGATKTTWFVGTGYKWGEMEVWAQRGLFTRRAYKEDKFGGVYGAAGYRFLLNEGRTWSWLLDVGLSYEPGMVKDIRYVADKVAFGVESAHVETKVGYGFAPEARLGINF